MKLTSLRTLRYFCALILVLCSCNVRAGKLPTTVVDELKRAQIPLSGVGVVVQALDSKRPLLSVHADTAMSPASTMKLLTTWSALEILGPAYRWKTEVYLDGTLNNGVLQGNLVFKGHGDPKLTMEEFWLWLRELRQRGLREIRGDIVLDRSYFAPFEYDPAAFDNDPTRAYNVGPDALLLNFNAMHLHLVTDGAATIAMLEPLSEGYSIENHIITSAALPCHGPDAYRSRLEGNVFVLEGAVPANCGEADDYFSVLTHNEYFLALFSSLWHELGGSFYGGIKEGNVPERLATYATHRSAPLSELIRDINKFSNNIMAKQVFLTLSGQDDVAADVSSSAARVQAWLPGQGLIFPELVIDNGAGLSRTARISPRHLVDVLRHAAQSSYASEFESSLPILGMDGTAKHRMQDSAATGQAHLKTGTLDGVKALAGYVRSKSGKQWVIAFIINDANASAGQAAQDALIAWLQER